MTKKVKKWSESRDDPGFYNVKYTELAEAPAPTKFGDPEYGF